MALISVAAPSASEMRLAVRSSLETDAHAAVVENRIVGTVGFLDLIERLDDQEARQLM
jgi:hypothetical protein